MPAHAGKNEDVKFPDTAGKPIFGTIRYQGTIERF
jgi:hypothetical protein